MRLRRDHVGAARHRRGRSDGSNARRAELRHAARKRARMPSQTRACLAASFHRSRCGRAAGGLPPVRKPLRTRSAALLTSLAAVVCAAPMPSTVAAAFAVLFAAAAGRTTAQTTTGPGGLVDFGCHCLVDGGGTLGVVRDGAVLRFLLRRDGAAEVAGPVAPFDLAGPLVQVGDASFLASGRKLGPAPTYARLGIVLVQLHLQDDPPAVVVDAQRHYAGLEHLTELACDRMAQRVFAFDFLQRSILCLPSGGPLPAQLETIVDSRQLPFLATDAIALRVLPGGVQACTFGSMAAEHHSARIVRDGERWKIEGAPPPPPPAWWFDGPRNANAASLGVFAFAGAKGPFRLEDEAGRVLATGACRGDGDVLLQLPIAPGVLTPGARYRLCGGDARPSPWTTIGATFGTEHPGSGLRLRCSELEGLHCGNREFLVGLDAFPVLQGIPLPSRHEAWLLLGVQRSTDRGIVEDRGGRAWLDDVTICIGPVPPQHDSADLATWQRELPIADDPRMAGAMVWMQWLLSDGSTSLPSPVLGGHLQHPSMSKVPAGPPPPAAEAADRAAAWLRSLPEAASTATAERVLRQAHASRQPR